MADEPELCATCDRLLTENVHIHILTSKTETMELPNGEVVPLEIVVCSACFNEMDLEGWHHDEEDEEDEDEAPADPSVADPP